MVRTRWPARTAARGPCACSTDRRSVSGQRIGFGPPRLTGEAHPPRSVAAGLDGACQPRTSQRRAPVRLGGRHRLVSAPSPPLAKAADLSRSRASQQIFTLCRLCAARRRAQATAPRAREFIILARWNMTGRHCLARRAGVIFGKPLPRVVNVGMRLQKLGRRHSLAASPGKMTLDEPGCQPQLPEDISRRSKIFGAFT